MQLEPGTCAVVTGAASGIGAALANRFADAGLNVVLADVDDDGLARVSAELEAKGVETLVCHTDVSVEQDVNALAAEASQRFGRITIVCNNAGVTTTADPWMGPISAWEWIVGVNLWGVIYGVRAFLPHLVMGGGGHIVNTASMAGLVPGLAPNYDATKHAVVALTENLYHAMNMAEIDVGVSVLCPGWVNTGIMEADRNWPDRLGQRPEEAAATAIVKDHVRRAIAEGMTPAAVADLVAGAIEENRYWVFPHPDWVELAADRWDLIRAGADPQAPEQVPGLPPQAQIVAEVMSSVMGEEEQ